MHHRLYKRLQKLYHQQVLHRSHLTFISSCLCSSDIKRTEDQDDTPSPYDTFLAVHVQGKWTITLNKTSQVLLKHLKDYHCEAISILTKEITNLEARLRNDAGFLENWKEAKHIAQRKATAYEEKKRNKMSKLTNNAQRGMRQRHRRKKKNQNRNNYEKTKRQW